MKKTDNRKRREERDRKGASVDFFQLYLERGGKKKGEQQDALGLMADQPTRTRPSYIYISPKSPGSVMRNKPPFSIHTFMYTCHH